MEIVYDKNYIRVIDAALDPEFCDEMVKAFELCARFHKERPGEWAKLIELDLHSTRHPQARNPWDLYKKSSHWAYDWTETCDQLSARVIPLVSDYKRDWDTLNILPYDFALEGFRIKCYRPNGRHEFKLHADNTTLETSSRFLACLFYLNDSDAGTEFPLENITVAARRGRLCIFTPTWHFPHAGLMPQDGQTKYILSTYLVFK